METISKVFYVLADEDDSLCNMLGGLDSGESCKITYIATPDENPIGKYKLEFDTEQHVELVDGRIWTE
jgi:hypothetical protein